MPRKKLIRTDEFPYHVIARTNNKDWFSIPMDDCWAIFSQVLETVSHTLGAEIASFVLMSNHFHMILWTPNENLDEIMLYLMRETSKKINALSHRVNHVYGGPYKWCLIQTERYLSHAYRYVLQNPIRANITRRAENYPYSTLFYNYLGKSLGFPTYEERIEAYCNLPQDAAQKSAWINEIYNEIQVEAITRGTLRTCFSIPLYKQFKNAFKQD